MEQETFLYFSYGSNMLSARLCAPDRCPSAKPWGVAELPGYELKWHKISKKDGSGKCDIVRLDDQSAKVFGIVYEIDRAEIPALDRQEGLGKGYNKTEVEVIFKGAPLAARTYEATNTDPTIKPYTWYRALVVAGAKEHGLPATYIAELEAAPANQDSDKNRHDEKMALIGEAGA
jgi:gamma-glutamylcyclotransferase